MEQLMQNEMVNSIKNNQVLIQNAEYQLKSTAHQRLANTTIIFTENLVDGQRDLHSSVQMSHDVSQYGPVILQLTELKQRYTPLNQSQMKSDEASTSNISGEDDLLNENETFGPNWNILDDCDTYAINSKLQNHSDVHDKEQQNCSNSRQSNLKTTILPYHTVICKRSFSCKICKKMFTQKSHLKTHMFIHSGEKPFSCSVCNKLFSQKSNLKTHMFIHSGEKPFACTVCSKRFSNKTTLKRHMLIHSGGKPFSCDVCNKLFSWKADLIRHMLIHSGKKPFLCSVCDKRFTRNDSLNQHMLTHSAEKPFLCSVCNKSFSRKFNLNAHMLSHTRKKV